MGLGRLSTRTTRLSSTARTVGLRRRVTRLCIRVLCSARTVRIGGRDCLSDRRGRRQNGRVIGVNGVDRTSLTRLATRQTRSRFGVIRTRDGIGGCGQRLGRLLRVADSRTFSVRVPGAASRVTLITIPTVGKICTTTLRGHPRFGAVGGRLTRGSLGVGVTGTNGLPAVDTGKNFSADGASVGDGNLTGRLGAGFDIKNNMKIDVPLFRGQAAGARIGGTLVRHRDVRLSLGGRRARLCSAVRGC